MITSLVILFDVVEGAIEGGLCWQDESQCNRDPPPHPTAGPVLCDLVPGQRGGMCACVGFWPVAARVILHDD